MKKNIAAISVGSNIDPDENIPKAKALLEADHVVLAESAFVTTSPIGFLEQADFINGAWLIETELVCEDLQAALKMIENQCGRKITANKFGPRTIDLDVVVWNDQILDDDVYERDFLKQALAEILPHLAME